MTSISQSAFADCVNLEEVVVPEQFETVGDSAFSGCTKLSKINLNTAKELKIIGKNAFSNCISLSKVTLPESVTSIGSNAFSIDMDTYQNVQKQTDVYYDGTLKKWLDISFGSIQSNPMYATGGNLYVNGSDLVTELDTKNISAANIGSYAFAGCISLKKIDLTGVTEIGSSAFEKSNVSGEVVIPETVKKFGTYAFRGCSFLEKLSWKSSVSVAMGAFTSNTNLKEVVISGDVTALSNWAFKGCSSLRKVTLPNSMKKLSQQSFQNCSVLKEINIPEGVTSIGNFGFAGCKSLEKISLPDSVTTLDIQVFASCTNLKEVRVSSDLTDLGDQCFSNCSSLETLELPEALTSISKGAFNECSSLKTIQIPASVKEIKTRAFYRCKSLSSITFMGASCPVVASDAFYYITEASVSIYIPENATGYIDNASIQKIACHLYSTKVKAAASCVSPGKEQYTCLLHNNCKNNYEKTTQIEHQPGEPVMENVVPATETTEGSTSNGGVPSGINQGQQMENGKTSDGDITSGTNQGKETEKEEPSKEETQSGTNQGQETEKKKVSVKSTSLSKVVNKKSKTIEVVWKKIEVATGYEVQYSTEKNFKKGVHTKKTTKGKVTIKSLKKNKKYYVRVRTYKTVNGKKYVSKWFKGKSIKITR